MDSHKELFNKSMRKFDNQNEDINKTDKIDDIHLDIQIVNHQNYLLSNSSKRELNSSNKPILEEIINNKNNSDLPKTNFFVKTNFLMDNNHPYENKFNLIKNCKSEIKAMNDKIVDNENNGLFYNIIKPFPNQKRLGKNNEILGENHKLNFP